MPGGMRYNGAMPSAEAEKEAARRATREMKTAVLVLTLSFVLVLVLAAVLLLTGHVKIF
jgi:multidrug efflux pump subunit AcrB